MNRQPHRTPSPVIALSDARVGNQRQAVALADAIAGTHTGRVTVKTAAPWRWLAPRALQGAAAAMGADVSELFHASPAVVVGCGRQAALATRCLRSDATKVVQILDPRIDPAHWDVVVVPEHDGLRGDNVVTLLGSLHPVDDAWLAAARAERPRDPRWQGDIIAVLLGGPTDAVPMQPQDIADALRRLADEARARGDTLLATTSRRTPPRWLPALRDALGTDAALWIGPADGDNPYAAMLAHARRIVCTPDSVNMLSEACATNALVETIPAVTRGRVGHFVSALRERGRIRELGSHDATDNSPLRETARVAAKVRRRLGLTE